MERNCSDVCVERDKLLKQNDALVEKMFNNQMSHVHTVLNNVLLLRYATLAGYNGEMTCH